MKQISMEEALRLCQAGENLDPDVKKEVVQERLRELVNYARAHSKYFSKAYAHLPDNFTLTDLPPTEKSELMKSYEDWVTDPAIQLPELLEYLENTNKSLALYLGKYSAITTSGTSGTPMPMVRDTHHNLIHGALIQTRLLRGLEPDIMSPRRHKLACIIFTDPHVSSFSSWTKLKLANPDCEERMLAISIQDSLDNMIQALNEFQPDFISAYPSVMGPLISARKEGRLNVHPQAMAFSAETLSLETFKNLQEAFSCPILNNYCSTEGGEAAMSCTCGHLHINDDWVIIEPIDKDGNLVPEGEWSEGIYITDLSNFVQPIIRYRMGDKVRITRSCACGSKLPVMEIRGRDTMNIKVGEIELPSVVVECYLHETTGIFAYQLAQVAERKFEFRAEFANDADKNSIFEEFKTNFEQYLSSNGCRDVELVLSDTPPQRSARGGKLKNFVREFE